MKNVIKPLILLSLLILNHVQILKFGLVKSSSKQICSEN